MKIKVALSTDGLEELLEAIREIGSSNYIAWMEIEHESDEELALLNEYPSEIEDALEGREYIKEK